jgi:hypothetical protein
MARKKTKSKKIVWKFTNQRQLTACEFARYFEKKVKSTIRKYRMPINEIKKQGKKTLKEKVINHIIKKLPYRKGKLSDENINQISDKILYIMIYGNSKKELKKLLPKNQPLYFLSDKEISLYAKLKNIKGNVKKLSGKFRDIDNFIKIIEKRNQDIRQNIVQALIKAKTGSIKSGNE